VVRTPMLDSVAPDLAVTEAVRAGGAAKRWRSADAKELGWPIALLCSPMASLSPVRSWTSTGVRSSVESGRAAVIAALGVNSGDHDGGRFQAASRLLRARGPALRRTSRFGQELVHHWGRTIHRKRYGVVSTLLPALQSSLFQPRLCKAHCPSGHRGGTPICCSTRSGAVGRRLQRDRRPFLGVYDLVYDRTIYPGTTVVARAPRSRSGCPASDPKNGHRDLANGRLRQRCKRIVGFRRPQSDSPP